MTTPADQASIESTGGDVALAAEEIGALSQVAETLGGETPISPSPEATPAQSTAAADPFDLPAELQESQVESVNSPLNSYERQRLEYLETRDEDYSVVQKRQNIDTETRNHQLRYESLGYDQQTAQVMANIHKTERENAQQELGQVKSDIELQRRKGNAATFFGKQYGVNPENLVDFDSPRQMERHARLLQYTGKQEQRLQKVEQGTIPAQNFNGAGGNAPAANANNIDELWMGAELTNPGNNPYDERYRKFLNEN
jgi:hypothetical protein